MSTRCYCTHAVVAVDNSKSMTNTYYSVAKLALDTINDELNDYDSAPGIAPFGFLSYLYFNSLASLPTFLHVHPFDSPIDP